MVPHPLILPPLTHRWNSTDKVSLEPFNARYQPDLRTLLKDPQIIYMKECRTILFDH